MLTVLGRMIAVLSVTCMIAGTSARASQLALGVAPAYGVLKADQKQTTWVRVGLTGFEMRPEVARSPVNVALVLDRSGSMQGTKIARAREAAITAINRLRPDDIVTVVTYDSTVEVLVPATKLTDPQQVIDAISRIQASGNTALFAGVSKGAAELRKFLDQERVNRIVLLSDGLANVGPSSPGELAALGASLRKENIAVSTLGLGLGYNEDLMVQLASRSGGNHVFIEEAAELADVFNREFDDVLSVVAQDVAVTVTLPEGIRPVRVLGNDAEINGRHVVVSLSQIYSEQDRHVVIEVEMPPTAAGSRLQISDVVVTYRNMHSQAEDRLTGAVKVAFSDSQAEIDASLNRKVMEDVVALVASENSKLATVWLDRGDVEKAMEVLRGNTLYLQLNAEQLDSSRLEEYRLRNARQVQGLEANDTNLSRKLMRGLQFEVDSQQTRGNR